MKGKYYQIREAAFDAVFHKIDAFGQARRFYNDRREAAGPESCIRRTR